VFDITSEVAVVSKAASSHSGSTVFRIAKRFFDVTISIFLLPVVAVAAFFVLLLNPFLNPGPLFLKQERMGRHCRPFVAYKFRSMLCATVIERGAGDPLEHHRISKFGRFLRRSRLDELPQVVNVLKGDMSLIGPRPDYLPHAEVFLVEVPGYRERHAVRPGISGLAQTEVGYVQGPAETRRKVLADLYYIRNAGFLLETWIVWRTLCTVFGRKGV
jgi:lipopolysaccharide/colanic/teichoic acid biosynthesis glycosyltransferase